MHRELVRTVPRCMLGRVSQDTIRRWVETLFLLYYGFVIRPWFRNVTKSLRKEPKWYLRDWSGIEDLGKRAETFVACHLLTSLGHSKEQTRAPYAFQVVVDLAYVAAESFERSLPTVVPARTFLSQLT